METLDPKIIPNIAWGGRGAAVQLTYNANVGGGWSPPLTHFVRGKHQFGPGGSAVSQLHQPFDAQPSPMDSRDQLSPCDRVPVHVQPRTNRLQRTAGLRFLFSLEVRGFHALGDRLAVDAKLTGQNRSGPDALSTSPVAAARPSAAV